MSFLKPKIHVTEFEVDSCLEYIQQLDAIVEMYGPEQPILIQIESPGGDLVGFFILFDAINSLQNPVHTYTTGMAASAAFTLLVAGNRNGGKRFVGENAHLMLHGVQLGFNGYSDLKDVEERVRSAKIMNDQFLAPVIKVLKLNNLEELEALIRTKTMSHDLNLTAEEAKNLGMVDSIGSLKVLPPEIACNFVFYDKDIVSEVTNEECIQREEESKKKKLPKVKKKYRG